MTIETKRLILRPFREGDEFAMLRNWTYDERVAKYCRYYAHKNIDDTKFYLSLCLNKEYCWAITIKGNDEPIGCVDLVGKNKYGVDELGYVLSYDYWGQGIMTEAVGAVIDYLFSIGYEKIGACHNVDNPASGRVMQKCGMAYVRDGKCQRKFGSDETCDIRVYEITKK